VSVLFSLLVRDGEENLTAEDVERILSEGIRENGIIFDQNEINHMTKVLMLESKGSSECMTFPSIAKLLDNHPELYESLSLRYRWSIAIHI
jgi:hypothetical protein